MRYISMFSGIEAASVALEPLGCEPVCFAELPGFASEVLAHHYPNVPNLGDMTKVDWRQYRGAADLVIGGPPCQAFSIAGLRGGLDDARGNLSLQFVKAVHAIQPAYMLAENVPGWLSMPDNAFGCFLAGLVGADDALLPCPMPRGRKGNELWRWDEDSERLVPRWPSAGMVAGPWARAAWRICDAQYFNLAQRRERVFVVAGFGDGTDPSQILFEPKSLRRDIAPRRTQGQDATHDLAPCIGASGRGFERTGDTRGQDAVVAVNNGVRLPMQEMRGDGSRDVVADMRMVRSGSDGVVELCPTLRAGGNATGGDRPPGTDVDTCESLIPVYAAFGGNRQGGSNVDAAALNAKGGAGRMDFETETLIAFNGRMDPVHGDIPGALDTDPSTQCEGFALRGREGGAMPEMEGDTCGALRSASGGSTRSYIAGCGVRRLLPVECEALMGLPRNYTLIPTRQADGPRYKALGNSFPVPVIRWLGSRILRQHQALCKKVSTTYTPG